jgi:hypothetical protein
MRTAGPGQDGEDGLLRVQEIELDERDVPAN